MSDLYKFITGANSITMYEEHDDGFRQEFLKLNQMLELDPETGNITLTTCDSNYIEIETFHRSSTPPTTPLSMRAAKIVTPTCRQSYS